MRKFIRQFIYKCDFFCSAELLRYRNQPEYRTILGGVISLILIIILMASFASRVFNTLNMMSILSSTGSSNADDPTPLVFNSSGDERRNFMIAVEIWHFNLNEGIRYFDINFINRDYILGEETDASISYTMEPCTKDHWKGYPQVVAKFDRLKMKNWLCMPKDINVEVKGKYSSLHSKSLEIQVAKCTQNGNSSRRCANETELADFFTSHKQKIYYTTYFINPLLNPDSSQYLTYYLQDKNYMIFSRTGGEEAQLMMSDYSIITDDSITPLESIYTEQGGIITENAIKNRYEISADNQVYCTFFIYKSPLSYQISRSYEKLDEILSYIGGLFGTIVLMLFIVRIYNGISFEITIASVLYKYNDKEIGLKAYNFLDFVKQSFYELFKCKLKGSEMWIKSKNHCIYRQQLLKQMDVQYLLKRVSFLERALDVLLEDHQLKGVHLLKKLTLDEAKVYRKNFKMHLNAIQFCQNYDQYHRKNTKTTGSSDELKNSPRNKKNKVVNEKNLELNENQIDTDKKVSTTNLKVHIDEDDNRGRDSDSSSSDSEDNPPIVPKEHHNTLELLLKLKNERQISSVSKRIYDNLSDKIKEFIDNYEQIQVAMENEDNELQLSEGSKKNELILKKLKKIDFNLKKRYNISDRKIILSDFEQLIYDGNVTHDPCHITQQENFDQHSLGE